MNTKTGMRNDARVITATLLIRRHFDSLMQETTDSESTFAARVREHYEATYLERGRTVRFSDHHDTARRMARDGEMVKRWLVEGSNARLPVEVLESMIAAFPPGRRLALQVELLERQGLLPVAIPRDNEDAADLGEMAREAGEAITAVARLLDDGIIDKKDRHKSKAALREINEAMTALARMRERIEKATSGPTPVIPFEGRRHG